MAIDFYVLDQIIARAGVFVAHDQIAESEWTSHSTQQHSLSGGLIERRIFVENPQITYFPENLSEKPTSKQTRKTETLDNWLSKSIAKENTENEEANT